MELKLITKAMLIVIAGFSAHANAMDLKTSIECQQLHESLEPNIYCGQDELFKNNLQHATQYRLPEAQKIIFAQLLHAAARHNRINYLEALLKTGISINDLAKDRTPLFVAVQSYLIFATRPMNSSLLEGTMQRLKTIHVTTFQEPFTGYDTLQTIQYLLEHGADPSIKGYRGDVAFGPAGVSPLELALKVKKILPPNAPEVQKVDTVIQLLSPKPSEVANAAPAPAPTVKSIEHLHATAPCVISTTEPIRKLEPPSTVNPAQTQSGGNRLARIVNLTRLSSVVGLGILTFIKRHAIAAGIASGPKGMALTIVAAGIGICAAWYGLPKLAEKTYSWISTGRCKNLAYIYRKLARRPS